MEDGALTTFRLEDPLRVDLLAFTGNGSLAEVRGQIKKWEARPSTVDGCIELFAPSALSTGLKLSSKNMPVLCLLEELRDAGWMPVERTVQHTSDGERVFDCRKPTASRFYLQAVLASAELFRRGAMEFRSGCPQTFYKHLLAAPAAARQAMPAKERAIAMARLEGDEVKIAMLESAAKRYRRSPPPAPVAIDDEFGGDDPDDLGEPAAPPPLPPPPQPVSPEATTSNSSPTSSSSTTSSTSSSSSSGSDSSEGNAGEEFGGEQPPGSPNDALYPNFILGQRVALRMRIDGGQGLFVSCNNPAHGPRCSKYRSLRLETSIYGERAAEYYLGAWLEGSFQEHDVPHQAWKPGRALVRAYQARATTMIWEWLL